jgi:hypothetical protein
VPRLLLLLLPGTCMDDAGLGKPGMCMMPHVLLPGTCAAAAHCCCLAPARRPPPPQLLHDTSMLRRVSLLRHQMMRAVPGHAVSILLRAA